MARRSSMVRKRPLSRLRYSLAMDRRVLVASAACLRRSVSGIAALGDASRHARASLRASFRVSLPFSVMRRLTPKARYCTTKYVAPCS